MSVPRINTPADGSCGYLAFYGRKRAEVWVTEGAQLSLAESSYKAQQLVIAYFKVPKRQQHMVTVVLAEKDGEQVTHSTTEL